MPPRYPAGYLSGRHMTESKRIPIKHGGWGINPPTSQEAGYHENTFMDRIEEVFGGGIPQPVATLEATLEQGR